MQEMDVKDEPAEGKAASLRVAGSDSCIHGAGLADSRSLL